MVTPEDDFPHPVPPQAFMTWKENWVFPARRHRAARRVAVPLLAPAGRGRGHLHRQVLRRRLGAPLRRPLARPGRPDDVRPGRERAAHVRGRRAGRALPHHLRRATSSTPTSGTRAASRLRLRRRPARAGRLAARRARPPRLPLPPLRAGAPPRGHDHDQGRAARGRDDRGRRATRNRDHSWGWRDDLTFRHHHWLCASFDDRFVEGSVMDETCYPDGDKYGGWISTAAGNDRVARVDTSDAYWLAPRRAAARARPRRPLPAHDRGRRDVRP